MESSWATTDVRSFISFLLLLLCAGALAAPVEDFPLSDHFRSSGRELTTWIDRFTTPQIVGFSPPAPGGDAQILRVRDPSGGIDSTRIGQTTDRNYYVQCYIYCEYRPGHDNDGYERVGIFARDTGGMFEGFSSSTLRGNNYSLTWDSNDGLVQCLRVVDGARTNMMPEQLHLPTTAWRLMRIEAVGDTITFKINGEVLLSILDTTHPTGQFGIGYHEYFVTDGEIIGTRAENFLANRLIEYPAGLLMR
jgi:hypothetical protein